MQDEILKKYFLGLLDSNESKQLEIDIFEDESLEGRLIQAEEELIEDFLNSNLNDDEIIAFNNNYLITEERKKRIEFTTLLRNYNQVKIISSTEPKFFDNLKFIFSQAKIAFAFVSVLFVLLIGISYLIFNSPSENSEIAKLNKRDLSNLNEFSGLKVLILTTDNLRSAANANLIRLNELKTEVLFRLTLPVASKPNNIYTANIESNNFNTQTISNIKPINQEVRILVPKSILQKGEYRLLLFNDQEKYSYYFAVQ